MFRNVAHAIAISRVPVTAAVNGKTQQAMAYIAEVTRDNLQPTQPTVDALLEGAREHNLTDSYMEKIRNTSTLAAMHSQAIATTP